MLARMVVQRTELVDIQTNRQFKLHLLKILGLVTIKSLETNGIAKTNRARVKG